MSKNIINEVIVEQEGKEIRTTTRSLTNLFGEEKLKLQFFDNEYMNEIILSAITKIKEDDPALVIQGTLMRSRILTTVGIVTPTHTIESLVEYIKNSGGEDLYDKHSVFAFKYDSELCECVLNMPSREELLECLMLHFLLSRSLITLVHMISVDLISRSVGHK